MTQRAVATEAFVILGMGSDSFKGSGFVRGGIFDRVRVEQGLNQLIFRDRDYFNLFREVESGRNVYFGNEKRWFSAVYVDDCVRAIIDAARSDATCDQGYFICDGEPVTWGAFQEAIVAASGRRVRTLKLPGFLVDVAAVGGELLTKVDGKARLFNKQKSIMSAQNAWTCSHDKARDDFGYRPRIPLEDGVRLALKWYRDEGWLS